MLYGNPLPVKYIQLNCIELHPTAIGLRNSGEFHNGGSASRNTRCLLVTQRMQLSSFRRNFEAELIGGINLSTVAC